MTFRQFFQFVLDQTTRFVSPSGVAFEWFLLIIGCLFVVSVPSFLGKQLAAIRLRFVRLANRRRLCIVLCAVLPVVIRLGMLPFDPVPEPSIHDEFSHLLLADTLVHGRLTNSTHPMWVHFESIHIIQQPTYNSMYPPGLAAFLALGQKVVHEPWAGVLLSVAGMCAALCWMMQQWLPPAWAFVGTLLAIVKFAVVGFWMDSYVGGSVPAIGGALLVGSAPSLRREIRPQPAVLYALGLIVLMNTRPFEGAILGLTTTAWILSSRRALRFFRRPIRSLRILAPALLLLTVGVTFEGYYFWRVTGNPMRMPYQVNRDTYGWPENLGFLPEKHLVLRHKVMQDMYQKEVVHREMFKSWDRFVDNLATKLFDNWIYFFGPVLTAPLLFLPLTARDRRTRPLIFFLAAILSINLFQMVLYPYHLGPVVPILFALVAQGFRHLYVSLSLSSRSRARLFMVLSFVFLLLVSSIKQEASELGFPLSSYWERGYEWHRDARASIEEWLQNRRAKQLVIVRYAADHPVNQEWVYNGADIDGSKVVWARDMGATKNGPLLRYFPKREVWLLEADVYPQRVVQYCRCCDGEAVNSDLCNKTANKSDGSPALTARANRKRALP